MSKGPSTYTVYPFRLSSFKYTNILIALNYVKQQSLNTDSCESVLFVPSENNRNATH